MQQVWLAVKTMILSLAVVLKSGIARPIPTVTVNPSPTVVAVQVETPTISENLYQAGKEAMQFWCGRRVTASNVLKLTQEYQQIFLRRGLSLADIKRFVYAVKNDTVMLTRLKSELGSSCSVDVGMPRLN